MNKKIKLLLIILGLVLIVGIIAFFVINFMSEEKVVETPEYPWVEIVEGRPFTPIEDKIVQTVLELNRSKVAHFEIKINGTVRGFYNRTIIVEAEGEQLRVPILEGAVVATKAWPVVETPEEIGEFLTIPLAPGQPQLKPFPIEQIKMGDIVEIYAMVSVFGNLGGFKVIVTPITN